MRTQKGNKKIIAVYPTTKNVYELVQEKKYPVLINLYKNGVCVAVRGLFDLFDLVDKQRPTTEPEPEPEQEAKVTECVKCGFSFDDGRDLNEHEHICKNGVTK